MRILFTAHQFFPESRAGVELVTLGLARELKARGHEPFVLAAKRSLPGGIRPYETEDYEVGGVPVRRVGRPEEGPARPYRLNYENGEMAERAREYALEVRPDVVHAMHMQGLSASVVPALKGLGLPVVFTAADFWTVCPVVDLRRHDGAMCEGPELHHCVRCIAARNPDPRVRKRADLPGAVVGAAGLLSRTPLARYSGALRQVADVRERPARIRERMEGVDRVLAYTHLTRDLLSRNGVGAGNTLVSPYGIDADRLLEAGAARRPSATLRVGFVGTLAPHKGPDLLVRAFRTLPRTVDATLEVHGGGEGYEGYAQELRRLAGDDGRIGFPGAFPGEELGRVLAGTDVLVVPSRWYENGPGVVFEALAAGAPVVATDLGGMSEFVRHGENGLLFRLDDAEDLARQLRRLAGEPGLLARLKEGIRPVKTVGEYAGELERVYAGLVAKK
ncbi:MAG: Glycosyl transferase, group 1 family protein [uncultured Rubrobacteraceae bacterium]|uniref:Glycosyl transferase, group 1 family protein n=1 Tax=uncultured Rubrobacteraceae bacterium TaxID=349277 RepID=A0A6J4R989_9ACTN|nr:MAG: Glycosyl transferase, group 1 family protein [uncultured Rubrobacteraceae bacterium]